MRHGVVAAAILLGLVSGHATSDARESTGASSQRDEGAHALLPVALPDVSRVHASVQQQLREAYRSLMMDALSADVSPRERSDSYGEMGTLFMAAEFLDEAERCYRNAQLLAPDDFRWPYYLGHLLRNKGELTEAVESFGRALQRRPADLAALVWVGRVYLDLGRPEAAEARFTEALSLHPNQPVARFELGRAALAKQDYASAVEHLNAALTLNPEATVIHYPLAMAYRQLGDHDKAEYHLQRRGGRASGGYVAGVSINLPDPLMAELNAVLQNPQHYRDLALEATANQNWPEAVKYFRKAVDAAPDYPAMRLNLAAALERLGDARAALEQYGEALRLDPRLARAHYSMGTLLERSGRDEEAIDRYTAAVTHNPNFGAAHLKLADALRRTDRLELSLSPYRRVIELEPAYQDARFGEAMALVRLKRFREAQERLSTAMKVHPNQPEFPHALARLLAAAPDDQVRDGQRAWELVQALAKEQQNTAVAETMAMALAELGHFDQAIEWQRLAMTVAVRAGRSDIAQRMAVNLALYEQRQPCRTPWRDDDADHRPGPPVEPGLLDPPAPR